jgi:Leucine-rich repeat (LRR) protein
MLNPLHAISLSNGGKHPYRLRLESTTGFVAIKNAASQIMIRPATGKETVTIPPSRLLVIWSCSETSSPTGKLSIQEECRLVKGNLLRLDCSHNYLLEMWVNTVSSLQELDCSGNRLRQVYLSGDEGSSVPGNSKLQILNCSANLITKLDLSCCPRLRSVNCSKNRLESIKLGPRLTQLENIDCSHNRLHLIDLAGLVALQQLIAAKNMIGKSPTPSVN